MTSAFVGARTREHAIVARKSDFASVVAMIVAAAVIVASLLVLVYVRTAQIKVGYRVHDLESAVLKLKQERTALDVERATLLRPARLADIPSPQKLYFHADHRFVADFIGRANLIEATVRGDEGAVVVFPHRLGHRGSLVTSGTKYMLRSDVMYFPLTGACTSTFPGLDALRATSGAA